MLTLVSYEVNAPYLGVAYKASARRFGPIQNPSLPRVHRRYDTGAVSCTRWSSVPNWRQSVGGLLLVVMITILCRLLTVVWYEATCWWQMTKRRACRCKAWLTLMSKVVVF